MMRHIAEFSTQPLSKYSLDDLLKLEDLTQFERLLHLEHVLTIGMSKIVLLLQDMPLGFGSIEPIRDVLRNYIQDLRDMREAPCHRDASQFQAAVCGILDRHRHNGGKIAMGLRQFQQQLKETFAPVSHCAELTVIVPEVHRIEQALDHFFTIRSTLRLLITHCIQMSPDKNELTGERFHVMHELLMSAPHSLRMNSLQMDHGHIGAVCLDTRPSSVLIKAYRHARKLCKREFGVASELFLNKRPAKDFALFGDEDLDCALVQFPYVDAHLYFIFYEVLKNALRTSVRKVGANEKPPPIHATLMIGTSLDMENERAIKISDQGEGMRKEDVRKVWSYFYSTGNVAPAEEATTTSMRTLGLPVTRVLARYFGGEIDLHSIPRQGTDVYIYL